MIQTFIAPLVDDCTPNKINQQKLQPTNSTHH